MFYLLAGRARTLLFQPTSVDQIPGVEPEGLRVAQQHLRLSVGVGNVLRIHVLSDAKLTSG